MRLGAGALVRGFRGVECKQEASGEKDFNRRRFNYPHHHNHHHHHHYLPPSVALKTNGVQGQALVACFNFIRVCFLQVSVIEKL